MADFKTINTRIALRTGDFAYWTTGAGKDIELIKGEVCICTVAVGDNQATTAPTVLFKVCDTTGKKFADLKWTSALAADVYAWAKEAELYHTTEVVTTTDGDKTYVGNALTKVEWDTTLNDGKGGLKFTKEVQFATKAELDAAIAAFGGDLSNITDNDHIYTFNIPEAGDHAGQLEVVVEHKINGATSSTETKYLDFVTPGELTNILGNYYTKTEVDELIQGVRDDIPTELGVMSVELLAGATNGSLKLKVNEEEGDDVVVPGLEEIKVKNATHADAAGKVDNALTVKVGGADVVFDGTEAKTADVDAAIAAAIDAAKVDYTVTCADTDHEATEDTPAFKRHTLTQNGKQVCVIDVPRDLVIKSGRVDKEKNELVLVLVNDEEIRVDVSHLIEYVTGGTASDGIITVDVDDNFVATATINDGTITEAKLHTDVAAKLNKVWDAEGAAATAEQNAKDYADGLVKDYGDIVTHDAAEFATNAENGAKALADQNKLAIDAINNVDTGILAQAKKDAADKAAVVLSEAQKYTDGAVGGLHKIATSGSIYDVEEAETTDDGVKYIILDCNW